MTTFTTATEGLCVISLTGHRSCRNPLICRGDDLSRKIRQRSRAICGGDP